MTSIEELKKTVLIKLWRARKIGKSYLPKEKALSKIPKHERGKGKEAIEELSNDGWIRHWKNNECVSICKEYTEEVKEFIRDDVPDYFL